MLPERAREHQSTERFLKRDFPAALFTGVVILRLFKVILGALLLLASLSSVFADQSEAPAPLLPKRIGNFRQVSLDQKWPAVEPNVAVAVPKLSEKAEYVGNNGNRVAVQIIRFPQDSYAYEYLSQLAFILRKDSSGVEIQSGYGTAGYVSEGRIAFFKGPHVVKLIADKQLDATTRDALISELSATLDKGEGDIPVLIKHLPNPEEAQKTAVYLHNFTDLNWWFGPESNSALGAPSGVFSAIESGQNADAVFATYGPNKLLLIEFHTPQLAADNDRRIIARIQELWKLGQPAPTAYQRVGNYSVFVFDAPDEQTAKRLISEIKYEQVVQWLGDNPNIYKEAEKQYINTTLGVLVAVLKASGYALIACLGLGGLIGGLLFTYRRAQQKAVTFSDAGGMLRLNLDDLTAAQTDPGRLLRERN